MPIAYSNMISGCECTVTTLPTKPTDKCECDTVTGRINDLYFIECSETISEANLLDTAWWQSLIDDDKIFNLGKGVGGYGQSAVTTFDAGGCIGESVQNIKWQLDYKVYCIDKASTFWNHEFAEVLLQGGLKNYNVIARYCGLDDTILPIGRVELSNFNNLLPESTDEFMSFEYSFSWKKLGVPVPLIVTGLSAVLPKAS